MKKPSYDETIRNSEFKYPYLHGVLRGTIRSALSDIEHGHVKLAVEKLEKVLAETEQ